MTTYSISGTVTGYTSGKLMTLITNSVSYTATTTGSGDFTFSNVVGAEGDPLVIYIDGQTEKASLVSELPASSPVTGITLTQSSLTLGDTNLNASVIDSDMTTVYPMAVANNVDTTTNLVAHYKMNDTDVTTDVIDSSGNSNTGTASTTVDYMTTTGKINSALNFDGGNVINFNNVPWGGLSQGTISLWIYLPAGAEPTSTGYEEIINAINSGNQRTILRLIADGSIYWIATPDAGNVTSAGAVSWNNSWHHIVMRWNNVNKTSSLYLDNVEVSVSSGLNSTPSDNYGTGCLAREISGGDYPFSGYWFVGKIDDFRVYSRDLSAKDISALYNSGNGTEDLAYKSSLDLGYTIDPITFEFNLYIPTSCTYTHNKKTILKKNFTCLGTHLDTGLPICEGGVITDNAVDTQTGLVAHYKMNDNAASTTVVDSSGNSYNGTASVNTDTLTTTGKINSALIFSGNQSIDFGNSSWNSVFDNNSFSISFWIKSIGSYGAIFSKDTSYSRGFSFWLNGAGSFIWDNPGVGDNQYFFSSGDLNDWSYITLTYDSNSKKVTFWKNGIIIGNYTGNGLASGTANFIISGRIWNVTMDNWFNGSIDDFRIYNRVLTQNDIKTLYNSGNGTEDASVIQELTHKIHTFTTSGKFTCNETMNAEILVVGGGGGGGISNIGNSGGGGGGGLIHEASSSIPKGEYMVTVGDGGSPGFAGQNSIFNGLIAYGGGAGGAYGIDGSSGGSGGGAGQSTGDVIIGYAGVSGQGHKGGNNLRFAADWGGIAGGGGGGAGEDGFNNYGGGWNPNGGNGGDGLSYNISGVATYYSGGGGGSTHYSGTIRSVGGLGGGGAGQFLGLPGVNGIDGLGGGGGGGGEYGVAGSGGQPGSGGSGVVIIKYPFGGFELEGATHDFKGDIAFNSLKSTEPYLLAHYKMNGNTLDSSGQNNGTGYNLTPVSGKLNGAYSFNGYSSYIDTNANLQNGVTNFSISAWVYLPSGATGGMILQSRGDYSSEGVSLSFLSGPAGTSFIADGQGLIMGRGTSSSPADQWFHVVGVFESNSGDMIIPSQFKIYQNGVQADDTDASYGGPAYSPVTGKATSKIGWHQLWGTYFTGYLDDVRIYNKALTLTEVEALYNSGSGTEQELRQMALTFEHGKTYSFNSLLLNNVSLESDSAGERFTFSLASLQKINNVSVKDSQCSTNNVWAYNSTNLGNTDFKETAPKWMFGKNMGGFRYQEGYYVLS